MNGRTFTITILAALLAVLTLAPAAGAECAWVFWSKQSGPQEDWFVINAFSSEQQCRKDMDAERSWAKGKPKEETFMRLCLPDTVDPRGPKP